MSTKIAYNSDKNIFKIQSANNPFRLLFGEDFFVAEVSRRIDFLNWDKKSFASLVKKRTNK